MRGTPRSGKLSQRLFDYTLAGSVLVIPFLRKPAEEDPAVYKTMFDQASDARFVLDSNAVILHANPSAARLFGATEGALYGVPFSELITPAERPSFLGALAAVKTPPSRAGPLALEGRFSDGSAFPIEVDVVHGTKDRYGVVVRQRKAGPPSGPAAPGRFNPGQLLIAGRIQELV
jgi:PAS domain S-box-containing protein